jgi:hypothetical protein
MRDSLTFGCGDSSGTVRGSRQSARLGPERTVCPLIGRLLSLFHLNVHQFASLAEAQLIIEAWRLDYS